MKRLFLQAKALSPDVFPEAPYKPLLPEVYFDNFRILNAPDSTINPIIVPITKSG